MSGACLEALRLLPPINRIRVNSAYTVGAVLEMQIESSNIQEAFCCVTYAHHMAGVLRI